MYLSRAPKVAEFFLKCFYENSCSDFGFLLLPPASFFHRWLALFLSLKAAYRLHHRRLFGLEEESLEETRDSQGGGERSQPRRKCLSGKDLILWLNRPTSFPNMHNSPVLQVRNRPDARTRTKVFEQSGTLVCDRQVKLQEQAVCLLTKLKLSPEHQSVFGHTACPLPRVFSPSSGIQRGTRSLCSLATQEHCPPSPLYVSSVSADQPSLYFFCQTFSRLKNSFTICSRSLRGGAHRFL